MEFFEAIYRWATEYIELWGYWGLILGMALESACMPVPSEIVLPFGGYLVSRGVLAFWPAVFAGTLGGTIGSIAAYLVGSKGGRPFIAKYGRYFFVTSKELSTADRLFQRYGSHIVFWARFMPVVRTFISLPAGIARMNFAQFVFYTVLGSLPWSALFVYIGVRLGQNWDQVRKTLEELDLAIIGLLVLLLLLLLVRKTRR